MNKLRAEKASMASTTPGRTNATGDMFFNEDRMRPSYPKSPPPEDD